MIFFSSSLKEGLVKGLTEEGNFESAWEAVPPLSLVHTGACL